MDAVAFAASVVLISASGVMAPGPLLAANLAHGMAGGARAGLSVAAGHAAVELPLVLAIAAGAVSLAAVPGSERAIAIAGAAGLFAFAALQARDSLRQRSGGAAPRRAPFVSGAAMTGLNPFFLAWWMTVGLKLISDAAREWSAPGVLAMFGMHVWMDFAWLAATAYLASRGGRLLPGKAKPAVGLALSAAMVYFGASFLVGAL